MAVAVVVVLALLAAVLSPVPAVAGDVGLRAADEVKLRVDPGFPPPAHNPFGIDPHRRAVAPGTRPVRPHHVGRQSVVIVPSPVYVVSPQYCTTPGYWSYFWVPQQYAYNDWVPGQWSPDGAWIDGHYETRSYGSGYWQPYWVEGSTSAC